MQPNAMLARELQQSATALRSLARDLIGPVDADDLVQETMLRALRCPPADPRGLRPWLTTVLHNLAHNHRRSRRRRRQHEDEAATRRPDHAAGPVSETDELRAVTEALWRLPEPYQQTLTQRYFAERTPTQIADDTSTPLATVKSRLQRGLVLLRKDLDARRHRSWRATLAVATGISLPAHRLPASTLSLMAIASKIVIGSTLLVAATWMLLARGADAPPPATRGADDTVAMANADGIDGADPGAGDREPALPTTAAATAGLTHAFAYQLRCRVLDRDGLIVPGARIAIAPEGNAMNEWPQTIADDGTITVDWRAKVPSMTVWLGLTTNGRNQLLRQVAVQAGTTNEIALLDATAVVSTVCNADGMAAATDCRACHLGALLEPRFDSVLTAQPRLHPATQLGDLLLQATNAPAGPDLRMRMEDTPPPPLLEPVAGHATAIAGIVRDRYGEPVADVSVVACRQPDLPVVRTRTRRDGSFRLALPAVDKIDVRAGGGRRGIARRTVDVVAGQTVNCELFLMPEQTLTGRVVLPDDASVAGWRVSYEGRDANWCDGVDVQLDGHFELANLPGKSGSVLLWSNSSRLPIAHESDATTGGEVVFDLRMRGMAGGRLRVTTMPRPDEPLRGQHERPQGQIYVFQVATGHGSIMPHQGDGCFQLGELPPGFYRVTRIGAPLGRVDLGEHWVDGRSLVDLGHLGAAAPGRLGITTTRPEPNLQLYLRRRDMDVAAEQMLILPQAEFLLPAGEWLMMWGDAAQPNLRTFAITAGERLALSIE